jgi:hypothetical protein
VSLEQTMCVCQLPPYACICCCHSSVGLGSLRAFTSCWPACLQWWVSGRNYAKYSPEGPRPIAIIKVRKQIQL